MKILLNDGMEKEGIALFQQAGIDTDTSKKDLASLLRDIPDYDGLVVRSATKVTKDVIESGAKGNLKIIGRAGVGYDNVDVDSATSSGIVVKIAPRGNTNAAAELALGLMLSASRNIPEAHYSLRNGLWIKKQFEGLELSHKILGIVGCGRIGQRLSELVMGFNMDVIGYDPLKPEAPRIRYVELTDLLKKSDYITLHTGGKSQIIGEKELSMMKPTAYLINTSRGSNIDGQALYNALSQNLIAGAALDVYSEEPKEGAEFKNRLRELKNVTMTPHLGASTEEAQIKTSIEMARVVIDYLTKGDFSNAVNAGETVEAEEKQFYPLFVYHKDAPGAFAQIDKVLADRNVNIRENPSRQLGKNGNAMTVYLVHQKVDEITLGELKGLPFVSRVLV